MKKGEKEGKEKFAISLKYNKMQRNEKCPLPSVNQRVAGSSPARGALKTRHLQKCECLFLYLSRTFHEQKWIKFKSWGKYD